MKQIDTDILDSLTKQAQTSSRKRAHYNLHPTLDDAIQRLCVAIEPDTYIRPHRHVSPDTIEVFLLLRGSAVVLFFDETGAVTERAVLQANGPVMAIEIPQRTMHTIASLENGTIFFEIKKGPYNPITEANYPAWSAAEGDPRAADLVRWYKSASLGEHAS